MLVDYQETPLWPYEPMVGTKQENGYLSPAGDFYSVGYQGHYRASRHLVAKLYPHATDDEAYESEEYLESQGWVKLSENNVYFTHSSIRTIFQHLTQAQLIVLKGWFQASGLEKVRFNGLPGMTLPQFLNVIRPE
jgi:hypothetical protein